MVSFIDYLKAGLTRFTYQGQFTPGLETCNNFRVTEFGLDTVPAITDPFDSLSPTFPYDVIKKGEGNNSWFFRKLSPPVASIDDSGGVGSWTVSFHNVHDPDDDSVVGADTTGSQWHFADFGYTLLAFNEQQVVFRLGNSTNFYLTQSVTAKTGCNFKSRLLMGNLNTDFWSYGAQGILDYYKNSSPSQDLSNLQNVGPNHVFWGNIGGGEMGMILKPNLALQGYLNPQTLTQSAFIDMLRKAQVGFMRMPWDGEVLGLLPLRDHVIVYGDQGISALTPKGIFFGRTDLADFGIPARGAFGGDENSHLFLSSSGELFTIDNNLAINKIGYQTQFTALVALILNGTYNIAITKDPILGDFYISSGIGGGSFILSPLGLSKTENRITSGFRFDNQFVALFENDSSPGSNAELRTSPTNFNNSGLKKVGWIHVSTKQISSGQVLSVGVNYRYDSHSSFTVGPYVTCNSNNAAYIGIQAYEFKIKVKCTQQTRINDLEVEVQAQDGRFLENA